MKRYLLLRTEEVDIALFAIRFFTKPHLFFPFFAISFVTSACLLFLGVESRRGELQEVCSIYVLTAQNIISNPKSRNSKIEEKEEILDVSPPQINYVEFESNNSE